MEKSFRPIFRFSFFPNDFLCVLMMLCIAVSFGSALVTVVVPFLFLSLCVCFFFLLTNDLTHAATLFPLPKHAILHYLMCVCLQYMRSREYRVSDECAFKSFHL